MRGRLSFQEALPDRGFPIAVPATPGNAPFCRFLTEMTLVRAPVRHRLRPSRCSNRAVRLACYGAPCDSSCELAPMSDLLQKLVQLTDLQATHTVQLTQMQLLRFWEDELAKPRNADSKRLLRYG